MYAANKSLQIHEAETERIEGKNRSTVIDEYFNILLSVIDRAGINH